MCLCECFFFVLNIFVTCFEPDPFTCLRIAHSPYSFAHFLLSFVVFKIMTSGQNASVGFDIFSHLFCFNYENFHWPKSYRYAIDHVGLRNTFCTSRLHLSVPLFCFLLFCKQDIMKRRVQNYYHRHDNWLCALNRSNFIQLNMATQAMMELTFYYLLFIVIAFQLFAPFFTLHHMIILN